MGSSVKISALEDFGSNTLDFLRRSSAAMRKTSLYSNQMVLTETHRTLSLTFLPNLMQ